MGRGTGRPPTRRLVHWLLAKVGLGHLGGESQDPEKVAPKDLPSRRLVAATGPDNHVSVFLQDDVGAVVKVEHGDGV